MITIGFIGKVLLTDAECGDVEAIFSYILLVMISFPQIRASDGLYMEIDASF